MKILFMGTPEFAVPTLKALVESEHEVVGVVTVADKPAGRGKKVQQSAVKQYAESQNLPVFQPIRLKSKKFHASIQALEPDLAVVVAFRMLPKVVWSIPKQGTLNLHAALLPDYRGAAPINWVVINGEKETGLTTFFIDEKMDTGGILKQVRVDLPESWTAGDLHDHMMEIGANLVLDTVNGLAAGELAPVVQDHSQFEHPAPKIFKEDCEINWDQPLDTVYNFIRGLSPYPTAWTRLGDKTVKIFSVKKPDNQPTEDITPGSIISDGKQFLQVAVKEGSLEIEVLQLQGKKRMPVPDFLRGFKGDLTAFQ